MCLRHNNFFFRFPGQQEASAAVFEISFGYRKKKEHRPRRRETSRSRLTAGCTHTPCGRVTASSLRLSHPAAALWSLQSESGSVSVLMICFWRPQSGCGSRSERSEDSDWSLVCVVCVLFSKRPKLNQSLLFFFAGAVFAISCGYMRRKHRPRRQRPVAFAPFGRELLPQPLCGR